eukprot:m.230827 g.230827  ORF g.230827 m.230827 type:complete len:326 (+) comp18158_c0_seq1:312-1289(+)
MGGSGEGISEELSGQQQAPNSPSNRDENEEHSFNLIEVEVEQFPVEPIVGDYNVESDSILGKGSFSRVFAGTRRSTGERVAVKVITFCQDKSPSQFANEAKLNELAQGSPHIVHFHEQFIVNGCGYLVYGLCPLGELFHHIIPQSGLDQRELIGPYFAQLVEALVHLHTRGICHLDIKPENMLLDRPGHIRLADFGLSALAEDGPVSGCHGSLSYAAPENLRSRPSLGCNGFDGFRADAWSVGVVLFVMLFGYAPWECAADTCATFRAFRASESLPPFRPWNRLPTAMRTIFQRTLSVVPNRRWPMITLKAFIARDCGWSSEPRS